MAIKSRLTQLACCLLTVAAINVAHASNDGLDLSLPASRLDQQRANPMQLALSGNTPNEIGSSVTPATEFEPPLISSSKLHQYFGISTIALAGLTALTAPEGCEGASCPPRDVNGTHATLAKATVAMAAATITAGLYAHWHDFSLEDGLSDPDNLHVILAVTGAAMLAYAANQSANSSVPVSHAGMAEAGVLGMMVAVKLTW